MLIHVDTHRAKQEAAAARLAKQQGGLKRPRPKAVDPLDPTGACGGRWFEAVLLIRLTDHPLLIPFGDTMAHDGTQVDAAGTGSLGASAWPTRPPAGPCGSSGRSRRPAKSLSSSGVDVEISIRSAVLVYMLIRAVGGEGIGFPREKQKIRDVWTTCSYHV